MLAEAPRFNAARRYGWALQAIGAAFAVAGLILFFLASARAGISTPRLVLPRAFGYLGAALCAASAAFLSAALLSLGRRWHLATRITAREPPVAPVTPARAAPAGPLNWQAARAWLESQVRSRIADPESIARWPPALLGMLFAAFALACVVVLWRAPVEAAFDALT
ncbi:MAG: hypothetical protein ABSF96_14365, partial [Steroidobacteraceae bacterium]